MSQMPINIWEQSIRDQFGDLGIEWFYETDLSPEAVLARAPEIDVVIRIGKPRGLDRFPNKLTVLQLYWHADDSTHVRRDKPEAPR